MMRAAPSVTADELNKSAAKIMQSHNGALAEVSDELEDRIVLAVTKMSHDLTQHARNMIVEPESDQRLGDV